MLRPTTLGIIFALFFGATSTGVRASEAHSSAVPTVPGALDEYRKTGLSLIERTGSNEHLNRQLREQTSGHEDRYLKNHRAAHLIFENDIRESDPNKINESVRSHAMQEAVEMTIGELEIVRRFRGGLDFKFGVSSLFSPKTAAVPNKKPTPEIRYGLVLQSIETVSDNRYMIAALTSEEEHYRYVQKARTSYSVEKKELDILAGRQFGHQTHITPYKQHDGWAFWRSWPEFDFVGNAKPKDPNSFTSLIKGNTQIPINYTIGQVDGLYQLQTVTPSPTSLKQEQTTHTLSVPVYDTTRVNRIYNEKLDPTQQSIVGMKHNRLSPLSLNLHHLMLRGQYGSELVYTQTLTHWTLSYFNQASIQKEHVAALKLDYSYSF